MLRRLVEAIRRRGVLVAEMRARTKEEAVRELVEALAAPAGRDALVEQAEAEEVVAAILRREGHGTTGFGRGVAVPLTHEHHSLRVAFGRSSRGIEWESMDGEPVHLVIMLITPQDDRDEHLRLLQEIARLTTNDPALRYLRAARDEEELLEILEDLAEV